MNRPAVKYERVIPELIIQIKSWKDEEIPEDKLRIVIKLEELVTSFGFFHQEYITEKAKAGGDEAFADWGDREMEDRYMEIIQLVDTVHGLLRHP